MVMKPMSRRDFLKLVLAGGAAAGLSHFRVLNFGGVSPVRAEVCDSGAEDPDKCEVGNTDTCEPIGSPDVCPDPSGAGDICGMTEDQAGDECDPTVAEPDTCGPDGYLHGDVCQPLLSEPDECNTTWRPRDMDECSRVDVSDTCDPEPVTDPDICILPDVEDICQPPGDPDICAGGTPDVCNPGVDPDDPNAVSLRTMRGNSSLLTALGGAAAIVALGDLFKKNKEA